MIDAATALFLRDGYARTSMEAVAASSGVSKRTLYKRHADKAHLLRAVVAALVAGWRPPFFAEPVDGTDLSMVLGALARQMLAVALTPEALALHRLAVAEAGRFPEIIQALHAAGVASGIDRIAALFAGRSTPEEARWHAEQFQRLVLAGPQQRALGFGAPLGSDEREIWVARCVALFLRGIEGWPDGRSAA